jgi:hypothetical protein
MKIKKHSLAAKMSSWIQKKHTEESSEEERRQLEGMELVAFAFALLSRRLLKDLDQVMAWLDKSMYTIPRVALILAVITGTLFVLAQVAIRLIPGFHIP